MPTTTPEPTAFKAEIRRLLDILIHSLYSDREIFLRELVSNASDALNRLRFEMLTNRDVLDPDAELEIRLTVDKDARTLTISDTGIGMTAEELAANLGTIAQSGAREFIEAAEAGTENLADMIGQFGVGFYSSFMVADEVRVTSRSFRPDAAAAAWVSTGGDTFTVEPAERERRGTTIEIKLKEDAADFADEWRLRQIVRRHSNFVAFPIYVGEDAEPANQRTALWRQSPRELDEEKYHEYYKQMTLEAEPPLAHTHVVTDAPVQLFALLYVPPGTERGTFSLRKDDGLTLYARKVLIQEYTKDLLPEYFRFVQGVVDSEDIPLNVSRELVQVTPVMQRLKKVLAGRVTAMLTDLAKDPETYGEFWERFGTFIKEGIATDMAERESLYPLLRFTTTNSGGALRSLDDYVAAIKPDQKKIYYILGDDPRSLARSPHLDYFGEHGYDVILLGDLIDSFMVLGLTQYEGFDLVNVAAPDLELPAADGAGDKAQEPEDALPDEAVAGLIERFKAVLGDRVGDVRTTKRLSGSIARLVDPEGTLGQEMQRLYKMMERDFEAPRKVLELNPKHPTVASLAGRDGDDELTPVLIEQIYENALLIEGLHPDPAGMIPRIEALMRAALD
ncbi:MAG TPA: molecular chaperone HtpG [Anaerolineales bacterium]|nr:molecular chaperone HtpG [Anaerolineales bacterium]